LVAKIHRSFHDSLRLEHSAAAATTMVSRDSRTTDEPKPIGSRKCRAAVTIASEKCRSSVAIGLRNSGPATGTGQLATSVLDLITFSPSARPIGIATGTAITTIFGTGTVAAS